jgi:hypothetical protein
MAVNFLQPSFGAGEVSPSMYARVDLAKYHVGAKLLRNFFVLPHGGAVNRAGTMFVGRCKGTNSGYIPQLIPFQFNLIQNYMLEFGHLYMRVIMNGGYVLEPTIAISGITNANPGVVTTATAHGYNAGDQVFISGTETALDSTPGRQYLVSSATTYTFTLTDLDGNVINTAGYSAYRGMGGAVARVYTLTTPYSGNDVQLIKWTQSADTLTLCHPDYPPQDLTRTQHWVWTLTEISFAPTIEAPQITGVTQQGSVSSGSTNTKSWSYAYVVTAVANNPPEESLPSIVYTVSPLYELDDGESGNTPIYNTITWKALSAASYYKVYKADPVYNQSIPTGVMLGFIGETTGTSFLDQELEPDLSQSPPQGTNPFNAGPISEVTVTNGGSSYPANTVLEVNDISGTGAVLTPTISGGAITGVTIKNGGKNYQNPTVNVANSGAGAAGYITVQSVLGEPIGQVSAVITSGGQNYVSGTVTVTPASGGTGYTFTPVITNGVITKVEVTGSGSGYTDGDSLVFTQTAGSGATFRCSLNASGSYPSCATYFQQRKVFAGSLNSPQTIWMTQSANFKNMDISNPSQASDAITATVASNQVNAIKYLVPMNNLVVMTSSAAWMLMGGYITNPVAVTPSNIVVAPQNAIGCADLPPIVINYDILYVQSKGSIVRDLAYNFYAQVYTGTDMSILSNHLFFGHNMERWCYAEQPFYQVWVVRDDGILLSFTYLKEQDVYAWAHHDSFGNSGADGFVSVASIPEQQIAGINVDSVYFVVERTIAGINGGNPVYYVERMNCRNFLTNGVSDVTKAWFVDCGLQYNGSAPSAGGTGEGQTLVVSGLDHLNGASVSILADGNVQPSQVVQNGTVTLNFPATIVTVGLPYVAQLQTLCMEPEGMAMQVQDYRKKIAAVAVRVTDTRGLKVGPNFNDLTEIKMRSSGVYMGQAIPLFTGDQRVVIDNQYLVDDDVCIQADQPLPCTILGIIPEVAIGDGPG